MNKKSSNYKKYKTELDLIEKHIDNEYFWRFIHDWGTKIDGKFYKLHSQISVAEAIFLHYLVMSLNRKSSKEVNVMEIGCAYGTSGMIIVNALNRFSFNQEVTYTAIDPFQVSQWEGVGMYNVYKVSQMGKKDIRKDFVFDLSPPAMKSMTQFKKRYDLIFIDGSHEYEIVMEDFRYSDKLIKPNGVLVLDDVLHTGVSKAVKKFFQGNENYRRVEINETLTGIAEMSSQDRKKSYRNPSTMHAYQRIR